MAASAAPQPQPQPSPPRAPDRRSKEIPPPLSLTLDSPAASSPFPSPSSSFVPPPMPGAHEFANKPPLSARFVRRKKSGGVAASASASAQDDGAPNGMDVDVGPGVRAGGAATPLTPTPASLARTPTFQAEAPPPDWRNTPTQMHITLPPPPASPSRTPGGSGSGTASKHASLSSSRPAPASPSPVPSRRQSRHRSALSIVSSSSKFAVPKPRRAAIRIRDFAFLAADARHVGRGPDAPKVIRRLLKQHGEPDSRRASGMSDASVESGASSSRRSSGFGGWGAFRWASKLGGAWGFGAAGASRTSGGYTPSQEDFERNFDGAEAADTAEYLSDYENDASSTSGDDDAADGSTLPAETDDLPPGLYRALYDFTPEGTAEMGLREGQSVRVVGRGGGVGWAVAVRPGAEGEGEEGWALVPEGYLRVVKVDGEDGEDMDGEGEGEGEGEEG